MAAETVATFTTAPDDKIQQNSYKRPIVTVEKGHDNAWTI